jgi:hypothetical protein
VVAINLPAGNRWPGNGIAHYCTMLFLKPIYGKKNNPGTHGLCGRLLEDAFNKWLVFKIPCH